MRPDALEVQEGKTAKPTTKATICDFCALSFSLVSSMERFDRTLEMIGMDVTGAD